MTSSDTSKERRKKRWLLTVLIVMVLLSLVGGYWYLTEGWAWLYGTEVYVYGFPMIMMDLTKDAATAVPTAGEITAPINQFAVMTKYPDASFRAVPRTGLDTTPPTNATWSVSLYDPEGYYVPNAINRYNLAMWMPLQYNPDGSLDLYIQATSPGADKEANWLPAPPSGPFNLTVRDYWPTEAVLDGTYKLPPVRKVQ